MKNQFETPEIKVIKFEAEDVITTSSLFPEMEDGGEGSGGSTGY